MAPELLGAQWLYPTCAVEGCSSIAWLENDHRIDWAASHTTVLDLLDRLCSHHHDLKTIDNWALVDGRGNGRSCLPTTHGIPGSRRGRRDAAGTSTGGAGARDDA